MGLLGLPAMDRTPASPWPGRMCDDLDGRISLPPESTLAFQQTTFGRQLEAVGRFRINLACQQSFCWSEDP